MSPLTVFIRTLAKSTAIFLGAGLIFLNPSLEVRGLSELKRLSTGGRLAAPASPRRRVRPSSR